MSDLWDNFVPLLLAICLMFFLYGLGQVIFTDMEKNQARFEQCIAADKQWVNGACVK